MGIYQGKWYLHFDVTNLRLLLYTLLMMASYFVTIDKTAKPCINITWNALLIREFVPVKTWLLIACDTASYPLMPFPWCSTMEWLLSYVSRWRENVIEPCHENMARFVLPKLILQTRMCSHPVGLDIWFLVGPFVYYDTSCVRAAKALARLRGCAGLPEPSLVAYVISTIISWAGSYDH